MGYLIKIHYTENNNYYGSTGFYSGLESQKRSINSGIQLINNIDSYDSILIMRADTFIKDHFSEIFNIHWNKIMFSSVCFKLNNFHKLKNNDPRIGDTIIFIPSEYFYLLSNPAGIWNSHDTWTFLKDNYKLTNNDLDVMLDTFHDSDTLKDWNPIYYLVNRDISNIHITKDTIVDRTLFSTPEF
jgi:hypothetical protein